jgi:hypothetical protein
MAKAGAINRPSTRKSTEAISQSTSRTRGVSEGNRARPFEVAAQIAAAPSVSGEELPAVRLPLPLVRSNEGGSLASRSSEVSLRGMASRFVSPTGITRSSKKPLSQPATALRWLSSASWSCSSRPICHSLAVISVCSPMLKPVVRLAIAGM